MSASADLGFTHIALTCRDAGATIDFYRRYAGLTPVHDRSDDGARVFWLSDLRRPFAIVFLETASPGAPLGPFAHLGVCLESAETVDALVAEARQEGRATSGPTLSPPPVGYWAFIQDPDGHTLELSFGQEVELHVAAAWASDGAGEAG